VTKIGSLLTDWKLVPRGQRLGGLSASPQGRRRDIESRQVACAAPGGFPTSIVQIDCFSGASRVTLCRLAPGRFEVRKGIHMIPAADSKPARSFEDRFEQIDDNYGIEAVETIEQDVRRRVKQWTIAVAAKPFSIKKPR
jgi:hypothetical protein